MDPTSIITIIELAVAAWKAATTGGANKDAQLADLFVKIAASANTAYQAQVGKPIDPTLIAPIQPIP